MECTSFRHPACRALEYGEQLEDLGDEQSNSISHAESAIDRALGRQLDPHAELGYA